MAGGAASAHQGTLGFVDPLVGTEGSGSQYGGMMPYTGVPFGSFHMVPMTRLNRVGQLSFNSADESLIGFTSSSRASPPSGWATGARCAYRSSPPR